MRTKKDMVPNPNYNPKDPNSKEKISRQKFDIDNRNIYTGKLLKPSSVSSKPKGLSRAEIQKKYPDSVSQSSAFTKSKKYPRVSKKN